MRSTSSPSFACRWAPTSIPGPKHGALVESPRAGPRSVRAPAQAQASAARWTARPGRPSDGPLTAHPARARTATRLPTVFSQPPAATPDRGTSPHSPRTLSPRSERAPARSPGGLSDGRPDLAVHRAADTSAQERPSAEPTTGARAFHEVTVHRARDGGGRPSAGDRGRRSRPRCRSLGDHPHPGPAARRSRPNAKHPLERAAVPDPRSLSKDSADPSAHRPPPAHCARCTR